MSENLNSAVREKIMDLVMPLLPKNDLSHWVGRLVHQKLPAPLARKAVALFAKAYNIDLNEAELSIESYESIGALFTRKLKEGVRPIATGVVHPADALITEAGTIHGEQLIQAKGKNYTVTELLSSPQFAADFDGGNFLTYYLCPTDYHRVHSPVTGEIMWSAHVPGELWPVNAWSVKAVDSLFAINERVVTMIQTPHGKAALVMVAATNVGNMSMTYDPQISTRIRKGNRVNREQHYSPPIAIRAGDEIGIFHMGSTVVMLYEKGMLKRLAESWSQRRVKMGESIEGSSAE